MRRLALGLVALIAVVSSGQIWADEQAQVPPLVPEQPVIEAQPGEQPDAEARAIEPTTVDVAPAEEPEAAISAAGQTDRAGQAGDGPGLADLKTKFQLELPGYWALSGFTVVASANYGTAVEPVIKQRFTAEVELTDDTFVLDETEGTVTWILPVARAGEKRTLYGIATSEQYAGAFRTEFELENNPMPRLGQPRDFFSGRTIVRGGDEEAAYLEELARPRLVEEELRHKEEVARRQRELELEELEHQAELARLRHKEELDAAEQEAAARAEEAERKAAEAVLAELAERARARLAFELPGYWRLADFELREGKAEGEDLVQAFTAAIELAGATFIESEREGPVVVVTPVAAAGERRELLGSVRWAREGESWSGTFTFENNPMEGLGQPLDFFEGRALVAGSEEDAAWRAARHAEELARLEREEELRAKVREAVLVRLADEEKKREQERQAELAGIAHIERVEQAERERAERVAAERRAEREALRADLAERARHRLAVELPGHWRLVSFEVQETAHGDRDGRTVVEQGFAATVELREATFEEAEQRDDVLLLAPVGSAGEQRTLYGVATAVEDGAAWRQQIELLNNPLDGLGRPLAAFDGRTLVQGTDEAEAYFEAKHEQELVQLRREEELQEQRRQAELAQQRHEQLLEEERQKVELARLQFEAELKDEQRRQQEREAARAQAQQMRIVSELEAALGSEDWATRVSAVKASLSSVDPVVRQTLTRTMFDSDAEELHEAALEIAFADNDTALRAEAFDIAFQGANQGLRRLALAKALESGDQNLQKQALRQALESGDQNLQKQALRHVWANSPESTLSLTRSQFDIPAVYRLTLPEYNEENNEFIGVVNRVSGPLNSPQASNEKVIVDISTFPIKLRLERSEISLSIVSSGMMEGTARMRGWADPFNATLELPTQR